MDKGTLQALKEAIAHWERLAACTNQNEVETEGCSSDECALCKMFLINPTNVSCEGCPIFKQTEIIGCAGTPFDEADTAIMNYVHLQGEFPQEEIADEILFLESFLPEWECEECGENGNWIDIKGVLIDDQCPSCRVQVKCLR